MSEARPIPLLPANTTQPEELVASILKRRGTSGLLKLDRMLLHSAPLCQGWDFFFGKIRSALSLSPRLKELIMCVVAILNGAQYQYEHHAPLYTAEGADPEQSRALEHVDTPQFNKQLYSEEEQDVIELARTMTRHVVVRDLRHPAVNYCNNVRAGARCAQAQNGATPRCAGGGRSNCSCCIVQYGFSFPGDSCVCVNNSLIFLKNGGKSKIPQSTSLFSAPELIANLLMCRLRAISSPSTMKSELARS